MKKKILTSRGFVLLPLAIIITFFVFSVWLYIKAKQVTMITLENNYNQYQQTNVNSAKQNLMDSISRGDQITNTSLNTLGKTQLDSWVNDTFWVIDNIASLGNEWTTAMENTVILDKIITSRLPQVSRVGDQQTPNKENNVFELDLVNFLTPLWTLQNTVYANDLKLRWWTDDNDTPDVYLVMTRVKKNEVIKLDSLYEEWISKLKYGETWIASSSSKLGVNYIKIPKKPCQAIQDIDIPDPSFKWCNETTIFDIVAGNGEFDLQNYNYKAFLIFWHTDSNDWSTPFKVFSDINGTFGVGNIVNADITLANWDNTKRRIAISTTNKNNILPYMIYTLWTTWKIVLPEDGV